MKSDKKATIEYMLKQTERANGIIEWAKMFHQATTIIFAAMILMILFSDNIHLIRTVLIYTIVLRIIMNILIAYAFSVVKKGLDRVMEDHVTS